MDLKVFKRLLPAFVAVTMTLTGCSEDVQIFKHEEDPGIQKPMKADALEAGLYYVKDGTSFIQTLPLQGSGANAMPSSGIQTLNKNRVVYAGPHQDTLIPTHYKGEIVAMSGKDDSWNNVLLERYKDMGYSVGFYNAEYDEENNELAFNLTEHGIKETDFRNQVQEFESNIIRVVGVDHEPLNSTNMDPDCGILRGMAKDEMHIISLYAGTYFHEIEVKADTQMFQSFEVYMYDERYVTDTPNGYRAFSMPDDLKSGYYAINGGGLFRYVNFVKGEGDPADAAVNEAYYKSQAEMLKQFSKQFSFSVDQRTKNMTIQGEYNPKSIKADDEVMGFIFSPDGNEYEMIIDTEAHTLSLELTEATPGRWVVNVVPMDIDITKFEVIDNTPDQELTQETYKIELDEDRENVIIRAYFDNSVPDQNLKEINITGTMIAPDGTTYVMEPGEEEDLEKKRRLFIQHRLAYAPAGEYEININHYPERTTVSAPQIVNNTETHTETIVIDG